MGYYDPELTPEGIRAKKQQEQIDQAEQNEGKNRDEVITDMRKGKFANKEGDTEIAQINREDVEQGLDNKDNNNEDGRKADFDSETYEFDDKDKVDTENVDLAEANKKLENNEVPSVDEEAALLEEEDKPKGKKSKSK